MRSNLGDHRVKLVPSSSTEIVNIIVLYDILETGV